MQVGDMCHGSGRDVWAGMWDVTLAVQLGKANLGPDILCRREEWQLVREARQ